MFLLVSSDFCRTSNVIWYFLLSLLLLYRSMMIRRAIRHHQNRSASLQDTTTRGVCIGDSPEKPLLFSNIVNNSSERERDGNLVPTMSGLRDPPRRRAGQLLRAYQDGRLGDARDRAVTAFSGKSHSGARDITKRSGKLPLYKCVLLQNGLRLRINPL